MPYLLDEHKNAVDIFFIAINKIRYSAMGHPMGLDLNAVIELVKLFNDATPIETIEKIMMLSREFIKDGD